MTKKVTTVTHKRVKVRGKFVTRTLRTVKTVIVTRAKPRTFPLRVGDYTFGVRLPRPMTARADFTTHPAGGPNTITKS